jgi:Primase X
VNSCLLRVPGSINSKNHKMVEVVQRWNGIRPAANRMLVDFYIKLAARELAYRSKQRDCYYQGKFIKKNYRHFGHTNISPVGSIDWIENLISNGGIADYRKLIIDLVLAPYLINIMKYDYEAAYNTIIQWLDKCGQKNPLRFNARYKVCYALNRSKKTGIKPIRLDTMKREYAEMYKEIILSQNILK